MKISASFFLVLLLLLSSLPAFAVRVPIVKENEIFFGPDKGKKILSAQDRANQIIEQQSTDIKAISADIKETNRLLGELIKLQTQKATDDNMYKQEFIRQFVEVMKEQNNLLRSLGNNQASTPRN